MIRGWRPITPVPIGAAEWSSFTMGSFGIYSGMEIVCLAQLAGTVEPAELSLVLLERTPKVLHEAAPEPLLWADARGLHARSLADTLLGALKARGCRAPRAGFAATPVAARVAAVHGSELITAVPAHADREWLAPFPGAGLDLEPDLANLLGGNGVE